MTKILLHTAGCLASLSLVTAQAVVAPAVAANAEGNSSTTNSWRNTAIHAQYVYDTTHFTSQGINYPIVINRLRWRANGGATGAGGSYTAATVDLGSSTLDFNSLSTTFATNRGLDTINVHNGPVTMLAAAGTTPNTWVVDIPLTTPFVYDPTLGNDILVDYTIPTGSFTGTSITADWVSSGANTGRVVSTSTTAATGTFGASGVVIEFGYTLQPGTALATTFGTGCLDRSVSFYQEHQPGTFDLAGTSSSVNSILLTPNNQGGYTVSPGGNGWFTHSTPDLALGDDAVSAAQTLSFTLNYPGGSTSTIFVGSNGHLWLGTAGPASPATGTVATFLSTPGKLSPYWTDLDPSAATGAGTVHFEEDTSRGVAYATWLGVPMWESTPSTPRFLNNVQVAIFSTGQVEFRYMDCSAPTYAIFTGFTPGNGAKDPGTIDISASMPFATGTDIFPLALDTNARPVLGTTVSLDTTNIPAGAAASATILSFTGYNPGNPLAPFGAPGCFQHVNMTAVNLIVGSPSASTNFSIPNNAAFVGARVYAQSASLVPGVNALGAIASNGLELLVGSL